MKTNCPHCNRISSFDPEKAGGMLECPECSNIFVPKSDKAVPVGCPDCKEMVEPGCRVCINCGYSFDTGKKVEKHIPVYGEDFSLAKKALWLVADYCPGLFKPLILFLFIASCLTALFVFYMGLFFLALGGILTCLLFASCALIVYAHGVGFFLTGEVQMLRSAMAELTGNHWMLFLCMVFTPPIGGFLIVFALIR